MENTVCFFNSCKKWGGGEKWHLENALYLKESGYNVIMGVYKNSELHKRSMNVGLQCFTHRISNLSFLNPLAYFSVKFQLEEHKVSHIVMAVPADVKVAGIAAKLAGITHIIYRRGSAIPIKNKKYNSFLFRSVISKVIANSIATKKTIFQNNSLLFNEENVAVIYNGFDINSFDVLPVKIEESNKITICTVGRMVEQKNQKMLIEVAEMLKDKGLDFIIKIGGDGVLKKEIQAEIHKRSLHNYVKLSGFVSDVKSYIANSDIFVLPSKWEGFGFVLAEAMALEKPIVAFKVSSNPELVNHNETGYLVPEDDYKQFAESIYSLVTNENLRNLFGNKGREKVEREFAIERSRKQLIDFLEL